MFYIMVCINGLYFFFCSDIFLRFDIFITVMAVTAINSPIYQKKFLFYFILFSNPIHFIAFFLLLFTSTQTNFFSTGAVDL